MSLKPGEIFPLRRHYQRRALRPAGKYQINFFTTELAQGLCCSFECLILFCLAFLATLVTRQNGCGQIRALVPVPSFVFSLSLSLFVDGKIEDFRAEEESKGALDRRRT